MNTGVAYSPKLSATTIFLNRPMIKIEQPSTCWRVLSRGFAKSLNSTAYHYGAQLDRQPAAGKTNKKRILKPTMRLSQTFAGINKVGNLLKGIKKNSQQQNDVLEIKVHRCSSGYTVKKEVGILKRTE
ncbi:MAG: hypothetical protein GY727_14355 [Gammaproteobacteria bacterium]|nr:hypothetical protein [Gammaproteobacteria bacterium]MCP4928538.1 hypothetical protein [Gammaproteobacteria bacterium]